MVENRYLVVHFFLIVPKDMVFSESSPTRHFFPDTLRLCFNLPSQKRRGELFTQEQ